jgi:hypothetical protein
MLAENTVPGSTYINPAKIGDAHTSGVSWGAVIAGATAGAAISLILLMLGLGLGLSAVSPWSYHDSAITASTIGWLIFMEIFASGLGGYLAGRLRVKWAGVHKDEVHFRDTAHGLLAWAFATLVMVGLVAGGIQAILGDAAGVAAGAGETAGIANPGNGNEGTRNHSASTLGNTSSYFSDMFLRTNQASPETDSLALRSEINRIFVVDLAAGKMPQQDVTYLGQIVAKRSGMNQTDAEQRVTSIYTTALTDAKDAIDKSRKAAAHSALWMFIALLSGAFVASLMAAVGGRQRDHKMIYAPG